MTEQDLDSIDSEPVYFDTFERIETETGVDEESHEEHGVSASLMSQRKENNSSSALENFPAELRAQILSSAPDLLSLRSLVRASPVLHAQYLHDRAGILCSCMERELDGFVLDAWALLRSRKHYIGSPRTDEKIKDFLKGYGGWISGAMPVRAVAELHPSSVRWFAAYHLSVARPLAQRYAKWALANLEALTSSSSREDEQMRIDEDEIKLSRSEEIRIFRALYRCDTFHHLFGQNRGIRDSTDFERYEVNEMFCGLFEPWENEAVGTVDLFIREQYDKVFKEVTWDLSDENPRFWEGGFNPSGSFHIEGEYDLARGLDIASRILAIRDHEDLVTAMERYLTHSNEIDHRLNRVLSFVAQADRRDDSPNYPSTRDEAERRRDPLGFVSDSVPPDEPSLGWCIIWKKKYTNMYAQLVPESLRRTGYVIWDSIRWDVIGCDLEELVAKGWAEDPKTCEWVEAMRGR
ncbi:hypothetical protein PG995_011546 [Apiospora arundinis]